MDLAEVCVGQLLYGLGNGALLVLGNISIRLLPLQSVHAVATDLPDGDARLFGIFAGDFPQLGPAFLAEIGDRHPDKCPFPLRIEAETRIPDGLFRDEGKFLIPYLHGNQTRLLPAHRSDRVHWHAPAVRLYPAT